MNMPHKQILSSVVNRLMFSVKSFHVYLVLVEKGLRNRDKAVTLCLTLSRIHDMFFFVLI